MECKCCFTEILFLEATYCSGDPIHFFCFDCAKKNVEIKIANSSIDFRCMDSSGCTAIFSLEEQVRFLDSSLLSAVDNIRLTKELRSANIDGLWECPFCNFAAIIELKDGETSIMCHNTDCLRTSCTNCRLEHYNYTKCSTYSTNTTHDDEETQTSSATLVCNNCNSRIIKDGGCNLIHCSCGSLICNVCKQDISKVSYNHFGSEAIQCSMFDY